MKTFIAITLVSLVTAARPALAEVEGKCAAVLCDTRTKHPMETFPCGTPECVCNDACGDSSSSPNANNKALAEGMGKLIAYTALGVAFLFMPGHMAEATSKDQPKQTTKQARAEWAKVVDQRDALVAADKHAKQARQALWTLDAEERAGMRDAPKSKPTKVPKPFNPPRLRPDLRFLCDQAKILMPSVHTDGPIGAFASEGDMATRCTPFIDDSKDADPNCDPNQTRRCGVTPEVCCPLSHPILNGCDGKCYRDIDFRRAAELGRHCGEARSCASFNPN